jgi:hypothetical protein
MKGFFLPPASKTAHHQVREAARQLLHSYVKEYNADLRRVWETERPFELNPTFHAKPGPRCRRCDVRNLSR